MMMLFGPPSKQLIVVLRLFFVFLMLLSASAVSAQTLASFSISPSTVVGGGSVTATIRLTSVAPSGGYVVNVSCPHNYVQVPAIVTVAAGHQNQTFTIGTSEAYTGSSATVYASDGVRTLNASFNISESPVYIQLSPSTVIGGQNVIGSIFVDLQDFSKETTVSLTATNPQGKTIVSVPSSVFVPNKGATFTITTSTVTAIYNGTITATVSLNGSPSSSSTPITVTPVPVSSISISPSPVEGGFAALATVTLSLRAPYNVPVTVSSNNTTVANPVSNQITIPKGYLSGQVYIRTAAVGTPQSATISATAGGQGATTNLTVNPPAVTNLSLSSNAVQAGTAVTGTVTLDQPAPSGGATVNLASNGFFAIVPATTTVPGGDKTGQFSISTYGNGTATITAGTASGSRNASLTVSGGSYLANSPWPKFQGNSQNSGRATVSVAGSSSLWEVTPISQTVSAINPVLTPGGNLLVEFQNDTLVSLNPTTGATAWSYKHADGNASTTPTIADDGTIYLTTTHDVWAINNNGTLKWSYATTSPSGSPAIGGDGTLYVGTGANALTALTDNGQGVQPTVKWSYSVGAAISSVPALGSDGTIYFGSANGSVYALNPNGTLKWSDSLSLGGFGSNSAAIGSDGTIYIVDAAGNIDALTDNGQGIAPTLDWSKSTGSACGSTPAISANGYIFVTTNDGFVRAYTQKTGSHEWSVLASFLGSGAMPSPVVDASGVVYVSGGISGIGGILALNGNTGAELSFASSGLSLAGATGIAIGGTSGSGVLYFGAGIGVFSVGG